MPTAKQIWGLFAAAGVLTALLYGPGFGGPFVYDDLKQIVHNPNLHDPTDLAAVVFNGIRQMRVWQNLSFALNWWLSPGEAWSFKVGNVLLHVGNGALLLGVLRRMMPERPWLALGATVIFLVHPLQVQSVAYVMGRVSLLQTLFAFGLVLMLQRRVRRSFVVGWLVLSLLAKQSSLLLPLVWLAHELTIRGRSPREADRREGALYFGAMLAYVPLYLVLRDPVSLYTGAIGFDLFPMGEYLLVQLHHYALYLWLALNPAGQSIIHAYPGPTLTVWAMAGGGAGLLTAAAVAVVRLYWRAPVVAFWLLFSALMLAPTNTVVQMRNPFAEYRLYAANAGLAVLFALALGRLARWRRVAAVAAMGGALLYFSAFTAFQAGLWSDGVVIYRYAQGVYGRSSEIAVLLGSQYEQRGDFERAEASFVHAIACNRDEHRKTLRPQFRLARLLFNTGRFTDAEGVLAAVPIAAFGSAGPPAEYYRLRLSVLQRLDDPEALRRVYEAAVRAYGEGGFAPFAPK